MNLEGIKMLCFYFKRSWLCNVHCVGMLVLGMFFLAGCSSFTSYSGTSRAQSLTPITDSPTSTYHPGKFVWVDLLTPDLKKAKAFYGELFGWSFEQYGSYTMIKNNNHRIAGIVEIKEKPGKTVEALWLTAMSVADVDTSVAFVTKEGGALLKGPIDMENRGRGALVTDPQGAQLVLLHAVGGDPADGTPEIGAWIWNEIWTNTPHETSRFYKKLGGYDSILVGDSYEVLSREKRWRGGIRYIYKKSYRARWVPAIRVSDPVKILEKVEELGGTVLLRPDEPPSNGDTALISDTSGALLMLQRWSPEKTEEVR